MRRVGGYSGIWTRLAALALIVALAAGIAGCGVKSPAKANLAPLTVGLLPISDSLPFLVAEQKGYFKELGLEVKLESFPSALERDAALQAKAIDGAVADTVILPTLNKTAGVQAVSLLLGATPAEGRFAILAAPGTEIRKVSDLEGVEIAISPNSIIEYTTDQMLLAAGLAPDQIKKTVVAKIPERFQLLMSGKLLAANLPDPMAALAQKQGATLVIDDTRGANISQTVILFGGEAIRTKGESIKALLVAYDRAVQDINANPEAYRGLMEEKLRLPKGLEEYALERFAPAQAPRREDIDRVVTWLVEKKLLEQPISYEQLVNTRFLP